MPEEKKVTGAVAKGENFWLEAAERAWFESHVCKCKKKKKTCSLIIPAHLTMTRGKEAFRYIENNK